MKSVYLSKGGVCLKRLGNTVFQQETVVSCFSVSYGPIGTYWRALRMVRTIWGDPACLVLVESNPLRALGGLPNGLATHLRQYAR